MYEQKQCSECGNMTLEEDGSCSECGGSMLNEGSCGCESSGYPLSNKMDLSHSHEDIDYKGILRSIMGLHSLDSNHMNSHKKNKHRGAYMAKSQLYKIHKYSEKLYKMIPDGHNLEDWMRSKLSQIADDISEVYHALDHDTYTGDI